MSKEDITLDQLMAESLALVRLAEKTEDNGPKMLPLYEGYTTLLKDRASVWIVRIKDAPRGNDGKDYISKVIKEADDEIRAVFKEERYQQIFDGYAYPTKEEAAKLAAYFAENYLVPRSRTADDYLVGIPDNGAAPDAPTPVKPRPRTPTLSGGAAVTAELEKFIP